MPTFAAVTAVKALKEQGQMHARCIILIEGCEESGSPDLPFYLEALQTASARRASSSASTPAPGTTTSSGRRRRCAAWSWATSTSRC